MKKTIILLVVVVMGLPVTSFSQFYVGPKIGINVSSFAYNYEIEDAEPVPNFLVGPSFGVALYNKFNDIVGLRYGMNFSFKGTAIDVDESYKYFDTIDFYRDGFNRYSLRYLELPVEGTFGFWVKDHYIFGCVGPYLAFFLNGKNKRDYNKYIINQDGTKDLVATYDDSHKIKPKTEVTENDLYYGQSMKALVEMIHH